LEKIAFSSYLEAIAAVYPKKNSSVLINGFAPLWNRFPQKPESVYQWI